MNLKEVMKEVEEALVKITSGKASRAEVANNSVTIKAYKVGEVIRVDIKEKKDN